MNVKNHDSYFDNVKLLLIFLVVFGHIIENQIETNFVYRNIYIMIYSFHMPLFVFVSGHFSKNIEKLNRSTYKIGLLYLFAHIAVDLFIPAPKPILLPYWIDWYMLSLLLWRLLIKWIYKIKFIIPISFAAALIAGFIPQIGRYLSLSRTIVLFPFFLLGFFFNRDTIKFIKRKLLGRSWLFLFAVLALSIIFFQELPVQILYFADSYKTLGLSPPVGLFSRFFILAAATAMCYCVLFVTSEIKYSFTYIGENSLYIYLLHPFLLIFIKFIPQLNFSFYLLISSLFVYLLGSKFLVKTVSKSKEIIFSMLKSY